MNKPFAIPGCGLLASLEKHFTRELEKVPTPEAVEARADFYRQSVAEVAAEAVETYEFADDEEVAPEVLGGQAWPVRQESGE